MIVTQARSQDFERGGSFWPDPKLSSWGSGGRCKPPAGSGANKILKLLKFMSIASKKVGAYDFPWHHHQAEKSGDASRILQRYIHRDSGIRT